MTRACEQCPATLGKGNQTGLCLPCFNATKRREPQHCECGQMLGKSNTSGLCQKCSARKNLRDFNKSARGREMMSLRATRLRLWEHGMARAHAPETRAKAGPAISAAHLVWCPSELRDAYRDLRRKGLSAAEAKPLILEQFERDRARFRRELREKVELAERLAAERERIQQDFARQAA